MPYTMSTFNINDPKYIPIIILYTLCTDWKLCLIDTLNGWFLISYFISSPNCTVTKKCRHKPYT